MTATDDSTGIAPSLGAGSWQDWSRQGLVFTEAVRGGPLVWPAGGERLYGDPLGPTRHVHDDAAEYYFILRGACRVEVGGEERVVSAGDLVYLPADAPHNLLGEVGDADMWSFILVAPNRVGHFLREWVDRDFEVQRTKRAHEVAVEVRDRPREQPERLARPVTGLNEQVMVDEVEADLEVACAVRNGRRG